MFTFAKAIIASGALIYGAANVDPVSIPTSVADVSANKATTAFVFAPDHNAPDSFVRDGSDIEANVEQAAEHFDNFAMQMPGVLGNKLKSVMKHGSKAILMEDSETKAAEEKMIGSLVQGLKHIGDAMAADMVRSAKNARG
jgi:hypothetical protein